MFHVTPAAIGNNQLTIDLPDLRCCDQIEITRVLQALTDAFVGHHQHAIAQQAELDRQITLFESIQEGEDTS
jgi:hypothetical protein